MGFLFRPIARALYRTRFGRRTIENKAHRADVRWPPPPSIIAGLTLLVLSFVVGWPLVALLTYLGHLLNSAWLIGLGAPAALVMSWMVFVVGIALIGKRGMVEGPIVARWLMRKFIERYGDVEKTSTPEGSDEEDSNLPRNL